MPSKQTITSTIVYCVDQHHRSDTLAAVNAMEDAGWRVTVIVPLLEGEGGALVACTTQIIVVFERDIRG